MEDSESCSENKHQRVAEVVVDIKDEPPCCIYKVPKKLRQINNDAYTPQVVSIGPYHHGKEAWNGMQSKKEWKWDDMQDRKKKYNEKFDGKRLGKIKNFVKQEEQRIRHCYETLEGFESDDFIEMIVEDAVFIIELLKNYDDNAKDFLLSKPWLKNAIKLDLQLLENQLPYFVLEESYMLAYGRWSGVVSPSFITLSCRFFGYKKPDGDLKDKNVKHFVDLRRHTMLVSEAAGRSGRSSHQTCQEQLEKLKKQSEEIEEAAENFDIAATSFDKEN